MALPNFKTINKGSATLVAGGVAALVVNFWPQSFTPDAIVGMQTLITFLMVYFGPRNR